MAISRSQLVKELEPGLNALFGLEYGRYDAQHAEIFDTETSGGRGLADILTIDALFYDHNFKPLDTFSSRARLRKSRVYEVDGSDATFDSDDNGGTYVFNLIELFNLTLRNCFSPLKL